MPSNWNTKREEPDMEKLQHSVDEWQEELDEALEQEGRYSRRYQNAEYLLRIAQRKLEAAQARVKEREDKDKLTTKELVDRVMDR